MNDGKTIDRTGFSIIALQLEGFCHALRATIPHGLIPGPATIQILKKMETPRSTPPGKPSGRGTTAETAEDAEGKMMSPNP